MSNTIGELKVKRGEVLGVRLSDLTPPVDTSPRMETLTEKNFQVAFNLIDEPVETRKARALGKKINEELFGN